MIRYFSRIFPSFARLFTSAFYALDNARLMHRHFRCRSLRGPTDTCARIGYNGISDGGGAHRAAVQMQRATHVALPSNWPRRTRIHLCISPSTIECAFHARPRRFFSPNVPGSESRMVSGEKVDIFRSASESLPDSTYRQAPGTHRLPAILLLFRSPRSFFRVPFVPVTQCQKHGEMKFLPLVLRPGESEHPF